MVAHKGWVVFYVGVAIVMLAFTLRDCVGNLRHPVNPEARAALSKLIESCGKGTDSGACDALASAANLSDEGPLCNENCYLELQDRGVDLPPYRR